MNTESVEIKSQGELLSTIDVPIYDTLEEAVEALNKDVCLSLINRQHRKDLVNTERGARTRGTSLSAQVSRALKGKSKEELTGILEALGIADQVNLDEISQ